MRTKKNRPQRNVVLPHYLLDLGRFLFGYHALRLYDRVKIVLHLLVKWLILVYVPFYAWLCAHVCKYYWGMSAGLFEHVTPWKLLCIPLPFFRAADGAVLTWLFCVGAGVGWGMVSSAMLNVMVEPAVTQERIEEKWRRACLHVGLTTATNLEPDKDVREYPPVISVRPDAFVVESKGITPEMIQERRTELSAAMGLFVGDASFLQKPDGSTHADLLEITFAWQDLPALVPFERVPIVERGVVILGYGRQGFYQQSFADMIHLGISGEPGSGKSVCLRGLITQLMSADRDAIILGVDFKGGAEFSVFEDLGNFVCVDEYESAAHVLRLVYEEYKRRERIVRESTCDTLYHLCRQQGLYHAPIYIIIDEATEFWDPESGVAKSLLSQVYSSMDRLARKGRFAAIHLIVCTQRASAESIPPKVRSMLTTRIMFKVSQKEDSIMVLGTAVATKLRKIPGRCYVQASDGSLKELQVPYLSKDEAKSILATLPAPAPTTLITAMKQGVWAGRQAA